MSSMAGSPSAHHQWVYHEKQPTEGHTLYLTVGEGDQFSMFSRKGHEVVSKGLHFSVPRLAGKATRFKVIVSN